MPAINENLKLLRKAKGMTQEEAADLISVTRQTVSSYESGRTQPDLETLKRLAEVYQADLNDVLYGGNRLQRQLRRVKTIVIILAVIMLLGVLSHSFLFWAMNQFLIITPGTTVTADNKLLIDMRFTLRDIAETIPVICTGVFGTGLLLILYNSINVIHIITYRRLFTFLFATILAMFACALPFAIADKVFGYTDYLLPIWNGAIITLIFFVIVVTAKVLKRHRSKQAFSRT